MKILSLLYIILLILGGCTHNEVNKDQYSLHTTKKNISLIVPKDIKNISRCLKHYITHDGHQFLFYLGIDSENKIVIYNLDSLKIHSEVRMMKEGPSGIGNLKSLFVHNLDTIFLTTGQMNKLFIINWKGDLVDEISIKKYKNGDMDIPYNMISHVNSFASSMNYHNKVIYAGAHIPFNPEPKKLPLFKTTLAINLNNKEQELLPMSFPKISDKRGNSLFLYFSTLFIKKKFIYSFLNSHDCLITVDHKKVITKTVKSRYVNMDFKMPDLHSGNMLDIPKTILKHPAYENFIYDPYRDVIYRFCYPGISVSKNDNLMNMNEFKPIFSIMILDTDLNILGETLMPENTYNMNMAFVGKNGLYLSTNHYLNKGFNADSLKFEIFNIVKNENK